MRKFSDAFAQTRSSARQQGVCAAFVATTTLQRMRDAGPPATIISNATGIVRYEPYEARHCEEHKTNPLKIFISDSTLGCDVMPAGSVKFKDHLYCDVLVILDGAPVARLLYGCDQYFLKIRDKVNDSLRGTEWKKPKVLPAFRSLPEDKQKKYRQHEESQLRVMGSFDAMPALMDLEPAFRLCNWGEKFYKRKNIHLRSQAIPFVWRNLLAHAGDMNMVLGWNSKGSEVAAEYQAQAIFLNQGQIV
jgi:hypothetical protein